MYLVSEVKGRNVKLYDVVKMQVRILCEYHVNQSYGKKRQRGGRGAGCRYQVKKSMS